MNAITKRMTLWSMGEREDFGIYLESNGISGTGVEVGVYKGEFSNLLLRTWSGKLIGVDLYNNGDEKELLAEALRRNDHYIKEGRYSILVCSSVEGSKQAPNDLAFVFIDADHSYEATAQDIRHWFPKIRPGGILAGHDYDLVEPTVKRAVEEFLAKHRKLGVIRKDAGSWFIQL